MFEVAAARGAEYPGGVSPPRCLCNAAERRLSGEEKMAAMTDLRGAWKRIAEASNAAEDTADRRRARRVLRGMSTGVNERSNDPEYRKLVSGFRPARGR